MKNIQQYYQQLSHLFNARHVRERILIAGLVATVILTAWLNLLYDPFLLSQEKYQQQLASLQLQIKTSDKQYKILTRAKQLDPNKEVKQRLALAQRHIAQLDKQLHDKMEGLIKPTQMATVLEQVLTQQAKLQFVRIQSLPAKLLVIPPATVTRQTSTNPVATQTPTESAQQQVGIYKHGIEIEFTGSYLDTLEYLKQLQQLPWHFYWDDVLFDVINYPKSRIVIRVHTLSLREGWIGV